MWTSNWESGRDISFQPLVEIQSYQWVEAKSLSCHASAEMVFLVDRLENHWATSIIDH